jgi:putative ATP-binding cassette transporter
MIRKYIIYIIILTCIEASLVGYIGWWRSPFWTMVQNHDLHNFLWYILYFTIAALAACFVSATNIWYQSLSGQLIRGQLTSKAIDIHTLDNNQVEGQSQRIQEDCNSYPTFVFSFGAQIFRNLLVLLVYSVLLIVQLKTFGYWYLLLPFAYAIIGTSIAHFIGKPLVHLNYINQMYEAKFRQALTELNYQTVRQNNYNVFCATKKLNYFQYFFGQVSVIFPHLVLAPLYFGLTITFGVFMQCASAMASMVECLSVLINNYAEFNRWLSCRKRLKELKII